MGDWVEQLGKVLLFIAAIIYFAITTFHGCESKKTREEIERQLNEKMGHVRSHSISDLMHRKL